jgi:hypothetical protein
MKSFELLLTVLFIIIIYLVVWQKLKSNLIIGTSSLLFVVLWITWDNMNVFNYNNNKYSKRKEIENKIILNNKIVESFEDKKRKAQADEDETNCITKMIMKAKDSLKEIIIPPSNIKSNVDKPPDKSKPKQLEYSENNYKKNVFDEIGSLGDNNIAHLMKHMSNKNRVAIDNMSRQNKYTNMHYFDQELKDHANSIWWDDESLESEF